MTSTMMRTTTRVVVPIVLVLAISLLLQGHNYPGGGFIGGVLTVTAIALIYVAYDLDYVEVGILGRDIDPEAVILAHRTITIYRQIFTLGLVIIVASGVAALLLGGPFLGQTYTYVHLPLFGEVELASALIFDVGIYCVVVGGLLTIFSVVGAE
jgi:multicomponent Na+:H+ antiporter subunit B